MKTTRYIAKCKCGAYTSTLATNVGRADADMGALFIDTRGETGVFDTLALRCRACGSARKPMPVAGKFSAKHICSEKCVSSHGTVCNCSCGGKNHGASFAA
jgi:hypothetical protein